MAAFARTELDLVGLARQDNQAAVQLFVVRDGKLIGRDVFLLDAVREAPDDEVLRELPRAVLRAGDGDPAAGPRAEPARPGRGRGPRGVPRRATRRPGPPPRPAAGREARADGPRRAQRDRDARPRAGPLDGRPGQDPRCPRGARRRPRAGRTRRCGSSATTSATSRATSRSRSMVVFEDGKPRTGDYRRFRIKTVEGPNDFASHQEVLRRRFRRAEGGEEGSEEELRWRLPDLVIVDGGKGQVSAARPRSSTSSGWHDLPLAGLAKEREELFLPGRDRADPPAADVAGALPRPAAPRRGPSVRDHLPPRPAGEGVRPVGLRRPARGRPEAAPGAPARLRLGQARPRGAGRADRGGARDRTRARRHGSRPAWRPDPAAAGPPGRRRLL